MKAKPKPARAGKRDLFAELSEGARALAQARLGKRTLRTHPVEYEPAPKVIGSAGYRGRTRSLADMEQAIAKGVKARHGRGRQGTSRAARRPTGS